MSRAEPHRIIYASPNGDHRHLLFDLTTGHSFVRHTGISDEQGRAAGHPGSVPVATTQAMATLRYVEARACWPRA